MDNIYP